jgi:hypothetical protein
MTFITLSAISRPHSSDTTRDKRRFKCERWNLLLAQGKLFSRARFDGDDLWSRLCGAEANATLIQYLSSHLVWARGSLLIERMENNNLVHRTLLPFENKRHL